MKRGISREKAHWYGTIIVCKSKEKLMTTIRPISAAITFPFSHTQSSAAALLLFHIYRMKKEGGRGSNGKWWKERDYSLVPLSWFIFVLAPLSPLLGCCCRWRMMMVVLVLAMTSATLGPVCWWGELLLVLFLPLPRQLLVVLDVGERDVTQHARCNTPKKQSCH